MKNSVIWTRALRTAMMQLVSVTSLSLLAVGTAYARIPVSVPEPSILSLSGIGAVACVVAYRLKNRK